MDRKSFIKSCRRQGYKYAQVARILGVSRQRVDQILKPKQLKARRLVRINLDNKPCDYPNCKHKGEAHHADYSQPLDVIWLCRKHHTELHKVSKPQKEKKIRKCPYCGTELKYWKHLCLNCKRKRTNKRHRTLYKNSEKMRVSIRRSYYNWKKNNPDKVKVIQQRAHKVWYEKNKDIVNFKAREKRRLARIKLST